MLLATTACAGCAAPEVKLAVAPSVLSEEWQQPVAASAVAGEAPSWAAFGSPELAELVERALAQNTDIAIARARVVQARGQLGLARAAGVPEVSLAGGTGLSRDAAAGTSRKIQFDPAIAPDISWEVDLFGGAAAGKRSARARLAAAAFDRDAAALLVESEVARAYFEHAALTDRIALVDRALENARELERIILVRVREGVATRVDSGLQTVEVSRIAAERSELDEARIHARNALALLVGEEAPRFTLSGDGLAGLRAPAFQPLQPAALLVRRPDVRAAEARIAAAEGDVDQARAAFLPRLTLSGRSLIDNISGGPLQLLTSLTGDLLAPIFSGGRLKGRLTTATGVQQEAVETYRGSLLTALKEGEDSLAALQEAERREALLAATIEDARTTARLARRQYVEGAADLQTVLDAERSLLDVEQSHSAAHQGRLAAVVQLFAAMGGWPAA